LPELARAVLKFLPILVASVVAWYAVRLLSGRMEKLARYAPGEEWAPAREQRARTLALLLRNSGRVVVVVVGGIMSLRAFGVDTNPLLAVSGVVGLAISFGSQSLVRDYVTGFLLQFEHQFGLGDVVRIGTVEGTVEALTLRLVYVRAITGALDIIPHGQITQVTNLSRTWRRAAVSVEVPWRAAEAAAKSLSAVADALAGDESWRARFLESPKVTGIEKFGSGTVTLGIVARTVPADLNVTNRELRRRVQAAFQRDDVPVVPIPVVAAATL
ncbi:MAG: mechanosensitive ion channel family protein, partial [Gemmatimonadaceae bacterium]